jgi:hypothetical protein
MAMETQKRLQDKLKNELELLTKKKLSNSEAWEAYFNLSGFFRVLQQMKKEATNAKPI